MMEIQVWMEQFCTVMEETFGERVIFLGLQGSYGRGEATEESDIDVVVILDSLSVEDLKIYEKAVAGLPHRELLCGFVGGREELERWLPEELFQFYFDTIAYKGNLDWILEKITAKDVEQAIHSGVCGIYHMIVHNYIHERSEELLKGLWKGVFFVLQAVYDKEKGVYTKDRYVLAEELEGEDQKVARRCLEVKEQGTVDLEGDTELLLTWTKKWIGVCGSHEKRAEV